MLVFLPAGVKEVAEKSKWFKKLICQKLKTKGIAFGFEIKWPINGLNTDYPYGVHLPNNLVNFWRDSDQREAQEMKLKEVAKLKPLYVVTHGIKVSRSRKGYEPTSEQEKKYCSDVGSGEYLQAAEELVKFIKYCQELSLPIALENTAFTNFSMENGNWLPETYIDLRVGTLSLDMNRIKEETGCELILDIEHLAFSLNFAARTHQYGHLPKNIPVCLSREEKQVLKKFGLFCRAGFVPVVKTNKKFNKETKATKAKIYHISGCYSGELQEIKDGRIVSHSLILAKDKCFRRYLKTILRNNPEVLVVGVDDHLKAGSQKESFESLCKYLLELF